MAGRGIVIGGGIVGLSIAIGLASSNMEVIVLDGGDADNRASYGNAGLIWVQSKGADHLPYALWSRRSASMWPEFSERLLEQTGIDVEYERRGGLSLCLDETELAARRAMVDQVAAQLGTQNDVEFVDAAFVRDRLPGVSPHVLGASWCPADGHVNPLMLMGALKKRCDALGITIRRNSRVEAVRMEGSHLTVIGADFRMRGERVVVAAGLATEKLAATAGMTVPLKPVRGQIVVTERMKRVIDYPTPTIRQARCGSVIFGNSHEEDVTATGTTLPVMASHAQRAMAEFPFLASARVLRSWGAIRVMPVDGKPIYARSIDCPGAYAVACHSGITLTAVHANIIGPAIAADCLPRAVATLSPERFDAVAHH